jgi:putative intracellular protease/amidase
LDGVKRNGHLIDATTRPDQDERPETALMSLRGGLSIQATASYADVPRPDVIVVPGGIGTIEALSDQALVSWISEVHEHTPLDDLRLRRLVPAGVSKALALGRAR